MEQVHFLQSHWSVLALSLTAPGLRAAPPSVDQLVPFAKGHKVAVPFKGNSWRTSFDWSTALMISEVEELSWINFPFGEYIPSLIGCTTVMAKLINWLLLECSFPKIWKSRRRSTDPYAKCIWSDSHVRYQDDDVNTCASWFYRASLDPCK